MRKITVSLLLLCVLPFFAIEKEEAVKFLLNNLSLPDRTDYTEDFYRENIDASFRAKEEMPWGNIVPDKEFLHFVLPVRVNNENLDNSRMIFYEELKDRVKDLTMEEAILEVNHWCHEHVAYQPSDARTSSPLSSLSQAIGRCGEESTFTVAALRSVGIPARQIYTPRWAHTDDNHAWVEAWANGKWYFLGACEPEPVLNLAWFNAPASRGLLMTTNVTGDYIGDEEILLSQPLVTRINVTDNYAPTGLLEVEVVNEDGTPAKDVNVNFCIYNYGEFYPAVTKTTDAKGKTSLKAGLGDIIVWASDGDKFGIGKGRPSNEKNSTEAPLKITLDKDKNSEGNFVFDIVPPKAASSTISVTEAERAKNDSRLSYEDSIRKAYISTFRDTEGASKLAAELNLDPKKLSKILVESRGNHVEIEKLLRESSQSRRDTIVNLLSVVSEKDRRDIPMEVIIDHIQNVIPFDANNTYSEEAYCNYILNPGIENEYLRSWRSVLKNGFGDALMNKFRKNPEDLREWIIQNIEIDNSNNPQNLKMSPLAVMKNKEADNLARNIFFVAAARTAGIPARINSVNGNVEILNKENKWEKIVFNEETDKKEKNANKGYLSLLFSPEKMLKDPKYFSQFTISKIENGVPQLLEYDENGTWSGLFSQPVELEEGQYILTTGQRLADGTVMAQSEIFIVSPNDTTQVPLEIRKDNTRLSVIGSLNAENLYTNLEKGIDESILATTGRGYYVLGIINPNHEPSEHALNDISKISDEFVEDGRKIVLLFQNEDKAKRFDRSRFPGLPENVVFGIDSGNVSEKEIINSLNLEDVDYPIFVIADSFNRIVWISNGYTIGLGEKLIELLSSLE